MDTPPVKRLREDNHIDLNGSVVLPSQVIYIKDLKKNVTEADFHDALSSFGPISYVMCMRDSGKALVEFENFNSAYQCIEQAKIAPIKIAGSPAVLQFSKSNVIRRSGLESHQPSNVLVIIVYNVLYPITLDVIYQICSTHGKVLRIALMKGKENMEVQALVEFDLAETAKRVKYAINGADIYAGCCTLKVEFSVLNRVKVIQNSHDQWDYTICDENANVEDIKSEILATSFNHPPPNHQKSLSPHQRVVSTPPANSCASSTTNAVASTLPPINIVPQPVYYMSVPIYPSPVQSQYLAQSHSTHAANNGNVVVLQPRKRPLDKDVFSPLNNGGLSKSPVLMVYGLDVEKFNCDRVFNLLCSYGDCLKVKFLRSMPGTCMTEMKNAEDAQIVIQHLRGVTIFGKELEFTFSRNEILRNPVAEVFKLSDETPSFKDYTNSRNLRFVSPGIAAKNKLVFPTKQLHFFNAPPSMSEEMVVEIFHNQDITPLEVILTRKKSDRSSSGFVTFESTSQALEALVLCNHTPIKEPEVRNPYLFKLAFALEKEDSTIV